MTDSSNQCSWITERDQWAGMSDWSDMHFIWREGEHFAVNNKSPLLLVNDIYLQRFPLRLIQKAEIQSTITSSRPPVPQLYLYTINVRGRCAVPQWWQSYLLAFYQALGSCRQRCSSRFAGASDRNAVKKRLFPFTGRKKATPTDVFSFLEVACGTWVAHISEAEKPSTHLNFSVARAVILLLGWISPSIYTRETPTQIFVCWASLNRVRAWAVWLTFRC